ncbi:MAG: T9SS type A sorting domain-containing protein [Winogradskyella sp.]|uniref:T9SS type A sorting domain-containing protein n=1 Tax=Winogradskyella sp. TaxID=1883156 RepID=UPI0017B62E01|nr:T9SS type A sorting domain-containing protein [Bacteroidia bacterium]NNE32422.1 T9SS type A sorting domain-containing protein [Winogradskyella sp.]
MQNQIISLSLFIILFGTELNSQNVYWSHSLRSSDDHSYEILDIAIDSQLNVYTVGYFEEDLVFSFIDGQDTIMSFGNQDVFISKHDSLGYLLWVNQIGGGSDDKARRIIVSDMNKIYVGGHFTGGAIFVDADSETEIEGGNKSGFIVEISASGNFNWISTVDDLSNLDGPYEIEITALEQDSKNLYVGGWYRGEVDFDIGPGEYIGNSGSSSNFSRNTFVKKLSKNGSQKFTRSIGDWTDLVCYGIGLDSLSNIYYGGIFSDNPDFNAGVDIDTISSKGASDCFIQKLDSIGNYIWTKTWGGEHAEFITNIEVDKHGNIFSLGYFQFEGEVMPGVETLSLDAIGTGFDIYLSKLDSQGEFNWVNQIGDNGSEYAEGLSLDYHGNIYLTGRFGSQELAFTSSTNETCILEGQNHTSLLVAGFNQMGDFIWGTTNDNHYADPNINESNIYGANISTDVNGDVYVVGDYNRTVDLDASIGQSILVADNVDGFIVKFHPIKELLSDIENHELYSNFSIYPNPSNGNVSIINKSKVDKLNYIILDINGRVIKKSILNTNTKIDLDVSSGIYFVQFYNKDRRFTKKIIIH